MSKTILLDGEWRIVRDPDNRGMAEAWGEKGIPAALERTRVSVPSVWNRVFGRYAGVMFYERDVSVPPAVAGERIALRFEAVNHTADAWLDGRHLGRHMGGYMPFEFDVTPWSGKTALLRLRVVDYPAKGAIDGVTREQVACAKESWYYSYGGVYGSVSLQVRAAHHLRAQVVSATPGTGVVVVRGICCSGTGHGEATIVAQVSCCDTGTPVAEQDLTLRVACGETPFEFSVNVPEPRRWSPADPFLYQVRLGVVGGDAEDVVSLRFGFRTFTLRAGRFELNEEPFVVKGVLLQPNYPVSLVVPTNEAMAREEIRLIKEAGFTLVRSHVRPADPRYLDLCDEAGLLVHQETACGWIGGSERGVQAVSEEMRAMVERDRHHASVVMWGILNENFYVPEPRRVQLLKLGKTLDPTRPWIDDSGVSAATTWERLVWVGQARSIGPGVESSELLEDHHHYPPVPLPPGWYRWLQQLGDSAAMAGNACVGSCRGWREQLLARMAGQPDSAVFVSEFGYGSFPFYDEVLQGFAGHPTHPECEDYRRHREVVAKALEQAGLEWRSTIEQSQRVQGQGLRRMIEAMRSNPKLSGYVVTQLNDAAWEHFAGILDAWRRPKGCYALVRQANQDLLLMIDGYQPVGYAGSEPKLRAVVVNDAGVSGASRLTMRAFDANGRLLSEVLRVLNLQRGIQDGGRFALPPLPAGEYSIRLALDMANGDGHWESCESLTLFDSPTGSSPEREAPPADVHLVGMDDGMRARVEAVLGRGRLTRDGSHAKKILIGNLPLDDREAWGDWVTRCRDGADVVVLNHEPPEELLQTVNVPYEGLHDHDFPWAGLSEALGAPIRLRNAHGFFLSNTHYLHSGRFTEGLPGDAVLDERFSGLTASYGVIPPEGAEVMGGTLCQRKFGDVELGVAGSLVRLSIGRGTWTFCQLRLREQIGRHPLADRVLHNLMRRAMVTP